MAIGTIPSLGPTQNRISVGQDISRFSSGLIVGHNRRHQTRVCGVNMPTNIISTSPTYLPTYQVVHGDIQIQILRITCRCKQGSPQSYTLAQTSQNVSFPHRQCNSDLWAQSHNGRVSLRGVAPSENKANRKEQPAALGPRWSGGVEETGKSERRTV